MSAADKRMAGRSAPSTPAGDPTAASGAARRGDRATGQPPQPRDDARVQPVAWLAVAWLMAVATLLPHTAPDLPPCWLPMGAAVVVSMRARALRDTVLLALLFGGLTGLAVVLGLQVPIEPPLIALSSAVAALQARHTGRAVRATWRALVLDPRPPALRRLAGLARFVIYSVLPPALLAGLAMAGLDLLGHWLGWDAWVDAPLPTLSEFGAHALVYAAASGLSVLVLTPLLAWDHVELPHRRTVALFAAAAVLLGLALLRTQVALVLLPVLAMLAGWIGGAWLVALCVALDAAALLTVMGLREVSPFEGPEGFIVMLLTVWRTMLAGLLLSVLHERRLQRVLLPRGPSGARVFRNLPSLRRAPAVPPKNVPAPGAGTLWLHIDLPGDRAVEQLSRLGPLDPWIGERQAAADPPPAGAAADGSAGALPSPRLPALMQVVARVLRRNDSVVPIAGEAMVVLVTGVEAKHLPRLLDRIDVAMVREGRRHAGPALLRQAALLDARAVDVLLTAAQYLTSDD